MAISAKNRVYGFIFSYFLCFTYFTVIPGHSETATLRNAAERRGFCTHKIRNRGVPAARP